MQMEIPVLAIIDQNIVHLGEQSGKGAWKRRAWPTGRKTRKEPVESKAMEGDRGSKSGKRQFTLRDEEEPDKENCPSEKKIKLGQMMDYEGTHMVEVASQEWPQLDQ